MKRKMILPLLAVLLAVASAFASMPLSQTAWFNDGGTVGQDVITAPTNKTCATGRSIQCMIGSLPAYDTQANAQNQVATGLLKYNN
jgi:hypothetical protein